MNKYQPSFTASSFVHHFTIPSQSPPGPPHQRPASSSLGSGNWPCFCTWCPWSRRSWFLTKGFISDNHLVYWIHCSWWSIDPSLHHQSFSGNGQWVNAGYGIQWPVDMCVKSGAWSKSDESSQWNDREWCSKMVTHIHNCGFGEMMVEWWLIRVIDVGGDNDPASINPNYSSLPRTSINQA